MKNEDLSHALVCQVLTVLVNSRPEEKYRLVSTKEFKNKNFKFHNINKITSEIKMLWVVCYEPVMGYNCNISSVKKKGWILNDTKKVYLVNAQLFEIKN